MMETLKDFAGFPCLIFPASRSLEKDAGEIMDRLNAFLRRWESHGSPVEGAAALLENRFVVVAHRPMEISGCSRDDLLFFMRDLGKHLGKDLGNEKGLEWLGAARVFYRDEDGQVADVDRLEFKRRAQNGRITLETVVFDTTLRETSALLEGRFALPAAQSWHSQLIASAVATA